MFHVFAETLDRKRNRRMKPGWANGGQFRKESSAKRYARFLRLIGGNAWVEKADQPEDHKVLVMKEDLSGWREVSMWGKKRFRKVEAYVVRNKVARRGQETKVRKVLDQRAEENRLIEEWLTGDLDANHDLLLATARLAKAINRPLHVNYGKRTYAEQEALFNRFGPGRAARPGTSDHETGNAVDVVAQNNRDRNVGDIPGARAAAAKLGIVFPYGHEPWHMEMG